MLSHNKTVTTVLSIPLSVNEKKVFEALLSLKLPKNIAHIARIAGLPRTTTSDILRKLEKKRIAKKDSTTARMKWSYNKVLNLTGKQLR